MSITTAISAPGEFSPPPDTLAEIVSRLGDVPLSRIHVLSPPRPATEDDLILLSEKHDIHCELVDGILVEKPVGFYESRIAMVLGYYLEAYFDRNPIGITGGESGPVRTTPGQVRMPDVSVVLGTRLTADALKTQKVLQLAPDLAIEVLSESNTKKEMSRKLREYFESGVRLVWYIDPDAETARVSRSAEQFETVAGDQELLGQDVLPGFAVKLGDVFSRAKRGT
jgi:Uma2 family endonuclease